MREASDVSNWYCWFVFLNASRLIMVNEMMNLEAFAWPIACSVSVVIAMLIFRKPLGRFLDRAKKIGTTGIEAATGAQDTARSEVGPSAAADEFTRLFDNQLLVKREDWIRTELVRTVGTDQTQKEKFLLRIIAAQAIVQQFESTYRTIWGSQLNALEITNATPSGVQLGVFETLYNQAAARDKAQYANYSFKQWLAYMESQLLVIRKDDKIYINLDGREFLKYIIHQGYTMYKYW